MKRREFIKKVGTGAAAAVAATAIATPSVIAGKKTAIKWRMQTYAGSALAEHVIKPSIDAFNKAANGEMIIELYNADQLVPRGNCSGPLPRVRLMLLKVMTTPWQHPLTCLYLQRISPLPPVIPWMFPHCGTGAA